jgi:hypothetical protein
MDAGFIKYTINFHSAKFMLSNVYQESSSPYQRPRHAQAKTKYYFDVNLISYQCMGDEGIAGVLSFIGAKVNI